MKKVLVGGLLAIGFICIGAPVFAIAPVINDFRSPIIADDTPVTNSNDFVYPDAYNLTTQASDPDNTVTSLEIKWSFFDLSATYSLNNRASLDLTVDDPNDPGDKEITGGAAVDDPEAADADLRTVTLRNSILSPLPLPVGGRYPDSLANGGHIGPQILPDQTKIITLFASDGQAASSKSLLVFTENKGTDRLSGISEGNIPIPPTGWTSANIFGATLTKGPADSLCIQTDLAIPGFGVWTSPFGVLTLVPNNVYRIRINVESSAPLAANTTPLWDFVIDNVRTNPDGTLVTGSQNKYSLDVLNWDTNGNANSVGLASGGRRVFDIWYTPLPVTAVDWNHPTQGEFTIWKDAFNDARFQFRVIDVQSAFDGQNDAGTVCFKSYQIDRIDINDLSVASTVYNETNPTGELKDGVPGFQSAASNMSVGTIFPNSTRITNGGGLTIRPHDGGWDAIEIIDIDVGDDNVDFTPAGADTLGDNWPIEWKTNELLRITAGGQAPDMGGELNPPDTLRILMDSVTSEIGMDSLLSAGANLLGMPKGIAPTTYTAFFHTQNRTAATAAGYAALRPRVSFINTNQIASGGSAYNGGGVTLKFLKVDRMDLTGLE